MSASIHIRWSSLTLAILALAMTRLMPHLDNFTPIIAMALFGGAYFERRWQAFLMPLMAMVLSDVMIELFYPRSGFHALMGVVYFSFALAVVMGFALKGFQKIYAPPLMALGASFMFFVITNFAVWAVSDIYPLTLAGLISCYILALPFFGQALLGDILYTSLIFYLWHMACRYYGVSPFSSLAIKTHRA